jgi:hypothetical protein
MGRIPSTSDLRNYNTFKNGRTGDDNDKRCPARTKRDKL